MSDHAITLKALMDLWPEGSPQHAALLAGIAGLEDTARLDKVERLGMSIDPDGEGLGGWFVMSVNGDSLAETVRAAIDGVPE